MPIDWTIENTFPIHIVKDEGVFCVSLSNDKRSCPQGIEFTMITLLFLERIPLRTQSTT